MSVDKFQVAELGRVEPDRRKQKPEETALNETALRLSIEIEEQQKDTLRKACVRHKIQRLVRGGGRGALFPACFV